MLGNAAYHNTQPQWKKVLKDDEIRAEQNEGGLLKTESSDYPYDTLHKKWSFPSRVSSVNVTKSAGNCEFGHIYWRNP